MNQRGRWTSVLNARQFSRGQASWHNTCWSIQVWNRTNAMSVKRHLRGRPICNCTSGPTQERSRTPALVAGDVSPTSLPLGDTAEHTQGNVHILAAFVEEHLRRPAPFTTTRRLAKGKGWTQQMGMLRSWKISACLIFKQSTRILNVIYCSHYKYMFIKQKTFHKLDISAHGHLWKD